MPDLRMPCFATQKIWASEYSVPTSAKQAPGDQGICIGAAFPDCHDIRRTDSNTFFPRRLIFVGRCYGIATSGAWRRTEECTAICIKADSSLDGGISPRTSAKPRPKYITPITTITRCDERPQKEILHDFPGGPLETLSYRRGTSLWIRPALLDSVRFHSCAFMSTLRPRNRTPSDSRRNRCSIAESPVNLIAPPAPRTRATGIRTRDGEHARPSWPHRGILLSAIAP